MALIYEYEIRVTETDDQTGSGRSYYIPINELPANIILDKFCIRCEQDQSIWLITIDSDGILITTKQ